MFKRLVRTIRGDNYQARAVRSTFMTLARLGGENALRLISNLILTRLLFPEAFGLMALVQVVIAGVSMVSDIGLRGAVVQSPRGDDPDFLDTAWTLAILRGALLTALVMLVAGPAARFYEEPLLGQLLMIVAFVPFINGFGATSVMTASRHLQIERVTLLFLGTQVVSIAAMVILAWWLRSVWALAIGNLVGPIFFSILSHVVLPGHSNRLRLERTAALGLLRYGAFIFLASFASFFANHGDRAVLGKFVEMQDLAFYNIAMMLASLPRRVSNAISDRVLFPLYARRPPSENAGNKRKIDRARRLVTAPLLLLAGAMALAGNLLVQVLYDTRYEAAGPYLVLIAIAITPQVITQSYVRLPLASGHSGRFASYQIVMSLVQFGLLLALVPSFGLLGAVIAAPLSTILLYPAMLVMIRPYRSWDPLHDALAFGLAALLALTALWANADVVRPVIEAALAR